MEPTKERPTFTYPDLFTAGTGRIPDVIHGFDNKHPHWKHLLCAEALSAYGTYFMKEPEPPKMWELMARIAAELGISGTSESFLEWSKNTPVPKIPQQKPKRRYYTSIYSPHTHEKLRKNFNWNSMLTHIRHDGSVSHAKKQRYFYYELNRGNGR